MLLPVLVVTSLLSALADGILVRVVSPEGWPLEHAWVYGEIPDPALPEDDWELDGGTTDADGFAFLQVDPEAQVELTAHHRLYGYFSKSLEPGEPRPVVLRLPEPPWELLDVTGRVLSPRGDPVPGVRLRMSRALEHAGRPWTAVTDAEGRFTMTRVMEDGYRVELKAAGYLRIVESVAVFAGMEPLELRLRSTVQVVGQIVGSRELDFSNGWGVNAISADSKRYHERLGCLEIPSLGADGFGQSVEGKISRDRYKIRLPVGKWRIKAQSMVAGVDRPWRAYAEVHLEEGGNSVVHLDLEAEEYCQERNRCAAVPIAGRVFDEETGEPVPGTGVSCGGRTADTAADGTFDIPVGDTGDGRLGWLLGSDHLRIRPPEPWAPQTLVLPEAGSTSLEISLRRAIGFCWEIRWTDGDPARFPVKVFAPGEKKPLAESKTDATGSACIAELPAGRYEIEPFGQFWRDGRVPFSIPTGTLALEVPNLGAVLVRAPEMMRDFGLDPPPGTVVRLESLDGGGPPVARESPPHFWIGGIPPGRWLVTLISADGREWSGEVDVVAKNSAVAVVR